MKRRKILLIGGLTLAAAAAPMLTLGVPAALADANQVLDSDRVLGKSDAPITIIEYASMTCPHCASFHLNTLPTIKKNWIETGKARLVYRDYPLDGLALRAATLAGCVEGEAYFGFVDALYSGQQVWARAGDPLAALSQIARLAGMDQATFDACISDNTEMDRILRQQLEARETFDIQSTPSFVINGQLVRGSLEVKKFEEFLEEVESKS